MLLNIFKKTFLKKREKLTAKNLFFQKKTFLLILLTISVFFFIKITLSHYNKKSNDYIIQKTNNSMQNIISDTKNDEMRKTYNQLKKVEKCENSTNRKKNINKILIKVPTSLLQKTESNIIKTEIHPENILNTEKIKQSYSITNTKNDINYEEMKNICNNGDINKFIEKQQNKIENDMIKTQEVIDLLSL